MNKCIERNEMTFILLTLVPESTLVPGISKNPLSRSKASSLPYSPSLISSCQCCYKFLIRHQELWTVANRSSKSIIQWGEIIHVYKNKLSHLWRMYPGVARYRLPHAADFFLRPDTGSLLWLIRPSSDETISNFTISKRKRCM